MAEVFKCGIGVSGFELQSSYLAHFYTNALDKGIEAHYPLPSCRKDSITVVPFTKMTLVLNNTRRLVCRLRNQTKSADLTRTWI